MSLYGNLLFECDEFDSYSTPSNYVDTINLHTANLWISLEEI